jgi:hypothetical protein
MGVLGLLGFASFVLVSLAVGARLLALAWRTRELPEAVIGAALFFGGGIGYALVVTGLRVLGPGAEAAPAVLAVGNACVHAGSLALAVGTWRIFRPGERWPAALLLAVSSTLAFSFALRLLHVREIPPPSSVFWTSTAAGGTVYLWAAAESLASWSRLRRRLALGLADPAVTRRVGLWGAGCTSAVGMHLVAMTARALVGDAMPPAAVAASSGLGFAAAIAIGLAFFPGGYAESARTARVRTEPA